MAGKRLEDMTAEEVAAERERKRVSAKERRTKARTVREAGKAVGRVMQAAQKVRAPQGAATSTAAVEVSAQAAPQLSAQAVAAALAPAPVSMRLVMRAAHLAGLLEAHFASGGSFPLASADEAREFLARSPIADSVTGELLAISGYEEHYRDWLSLV